MSWQEDHGTFRATPGETAEVTLSGQAGSPAVVVRWHYYDPYTGDNGWYAQVDDVSLACWTTAAWGDIDCSGLVNAIDALKVLRHSAGLNSAQTEPCPDVGSMVTPNMATAGIMGDVDCSEAVSAVDALKVLRTVAGLPITPAVCPTIGISVDLYY
jgi:hypothetical protein